MPHFRSDEILWFNPSGAPWGELGYAVPNFGDDHSTINNTIAYLVQVMGRNLSAVMHHGDVDLFVPPTINTLQRVHKLIIRARSILSARAVAPGTPRFEAVHATPSREPFIIFPVPYWRARNPWLKEWCGLILNAIGEACQHTENGNAYEISTDFAGLIGQYLQRVYVREATELFGVPGADANKPDFTLSDAHFASYNPSKFFTSTELIDTPPQLEELRTEDDLLPLTNGIPATQLAGVMKHPRGVADGAVVGNTSATPQSTTINTGAFVAPPSP